MTIALGLMLAVLMGATLGLLGGGGSILTVPILVYVLGMGAKAAMATSLLVVGVTSIASLLQHARADNVRWRVGALFGTLAMVGAYGGGRAAAYLPESLLLALFAAMLLATAFAMLRPGKAEDTNPEPSDRPPLRAAVIAGEGLLVGAFTGLVGAGGGFLVVPALVLFARVEIRSAIGTSLMIIAMKSFAGFAGYLAHVSIDVPLAAAVTAAAVGGAAIGTRFATRVSDRALQTAFALFVLAMGAAMLLAQIPAAIRWPLAGGALIGISASALFVFNGKIAGISGIIGGLLDNAAEGRGWRASFVAGLLTGGLLLRWSIPEALAIDDGGSLATLAVAGGLVGFGTRLGNGCTSGHGVCGISRGSGRSIAAVITFMTTAIGVVYVMRHLVGGGS